jgi:nucleoside-diphosphate kinase
MTSDVITGMEIVTSNGIEKFKSLVGSKDTPNSLRNMFASDDFVRNSIHFSESVQHVKKELNFFFEPKVAKTTAIMNNCTLCLIKPHIIKSA